MSKHHLRKDKTCQNCGYPVEKRFCSSCGQENIETRQSFGHLVRHFAEDFTHYEGNFWKTIKYLLCRPAYLTKTYLSGKRMSYVAPVKLYIFISFIAFFVPAILPHFNISKGPGSLKIIGKKLNEVGDKIASLDDSLQKSPDLVKTNTKDRPAKITDATGYYASPEEYDSIQNTLPEAKKDSYINGFVNRRLSKYHGENVKELRAKVLENFNHNLPKALFIYLPLFAFVLWLFHGKKRWFYFDHAIFTLHYFSFLLLVITIRNIVFHLIPWYFIIAPATLSLIFGMLIWLWSVFYFYRGHRRLYEERRIVSRLKATVILFINSILFIVLLCCFFLFTMLTA